MMSKVAHNEALKNQQCQLLKTNSSVINDTAVIQPSFAVGFFFVEDRPCGAVSSLSCDKKTFPKNTAWKRR